MRELSPASRSNIRRHWDVLCHEIGHRLAGSAGEQEAADYIEDRMRRLGLAEVRQERFDFPNWSNRRCAMKVSGPRSRRATRRVPGVRAGVYSAATPPKGVRGPLAYLQSGLPLDFEQSLKGKIGLLIGTFAIADEQVKRRVIRSGLEALITVDMRVPFAWSVTGGAAPHWVDGFRMPLAGMPYLEAIRLVEQMPLTAQLTFDARCFPDTSQNVIGELPGHGRSDEVILVTGHHDCVAGNVGADDNGSGVIFVLELARILARRRLRRTVRFISYGVEERLSIGSYLYMRSLSRAEQRRIQLVANADSISSAVGTDEVRITGTPALHRLVQRVWDANRHPVQMPARVHAYSDHYPFNIVGVPSVSLGRPGIVAGGCWQLHSEHDNVDHVSSAVLARTIDTTADLLERVANARTLPFPRRIEPRLAREVATIAKNIYHHPWSPADFDYDR